MDRDEWLNLPQTDPQRWRTIVWATRQAFTDTESVLDELQAAGLDRLFRSVLIHLGYKLEAQSDGLTQINLQSGEQSHWVRRIARFLLEPENSGRPAHELATDLRALGYAVNVDA